MNLKFMKKTLNKQLESKKNILFNWIEFFDLSVNEIILRNISMHLQSSNNYNISNLSNWLLIHKISRVGYRMIEFPENIKNIDEANDFLNKWSDNYKNFIKNSSWYFLYEWKLFIIISMDNDVDYFKNMYQQKTDDIIDK